MLKVRIKAVKAIYEAISKKMLGALLMAVISIRPSVIVEAREAIKPERNSSTR